MFKQTINTNLKRILAILLLLSILLPTLTALAAPTSRYAQTNTFETSGSPLLNPNYTSNQWNRWETVAWGVFLSNFVVPMADTYESAYSTSSNQGSRGSGFKALNFSTAGDPASRGILQDFTQFAVDSAMNTFKDLEVTYYYLDQAGNIIEPETPGDPSSTAKLVDKERNPTKKDISPETTALATFGSLLPRNLGDISDVTVKDNLLKNEAGAWIAGVDYTGTAFDDVLGVNAVEFYPSGWFEKVAKLGNSTAGNPSLIFIPPSANSTLNRTQTAPLNSISQVPLGHVTATSTHAIKDVAVAKLPIIWLKASDNTYVRVWDMLDPWDYQVLIAMLAKEVNSDSTYDSGLGTKAVWETVMTNIDKAMEQGTALQMDPFGNIVTMIDGDPIMVIPAAYNKHITTTPMVNLVNSLFLTGPTSGVSSEQLLSKGKMPTRAWNWWMRNTNETANDGVSVFGPGFPAFGWEGTAMPNNAVSLYFDSDSLAYMTYKDRVKSDNDKFYSESQKYNDTTLLPHISAVLGVLDLELDGNRKYTRGDTTDLVVPRLVLTGMSKASGLGKNDNLSYRDKGEGVKSLMVNLTFQEGIIGLLPPSFNESDVKYEQTMTWQNVKTDVLNSPVVVPVAMQSGVDSGQQTWAGLARNFVNYYGTEFYPQNKESELARISAGTNDKSYSNKTAMDELTRYLMYNADELPSLPLVMHARTPAMTPYIKVIALGDGNKTITWPKAWDDWFDNTGFIWREASYLKENTLDIGLKGDITTRGYNYTSMSQRWVKAYPTNKTLSKVASYLGMRGDSEFAAASAPYIYLSYLNLYGVGSVDGSSGVNVSTLNANPTKFNDKIFDSKGSSIFSYNPADNTNIRSSEDMVKETTESIWKLLSPVHGHEYKRQLFSSIIGNFIYDQYTTMVYGGSLEYRAGGVQETITRSQTGFLRFPSLEDNVFTRWFYQEYVTVAIFLLAVGLVFIIVLGIFRGRKFTWFLVSVVLLVSSVVIIPFINDLASNSMDGLVSSILKDKTTVWSMTEFISNDNIEDDFATAGLSPEEAEIASDITKSLSIAYTDRALMLKQDISHKVISLGNFAAYQQFASTRWMLPNIMRQFTAEDNSNAYLYVPLADVADDAANAYWWFNPEDALVSGKRSAGDLQKRYAVGTSAGVAKAQYTEDNIKEFYPNYHWTDTSQVYDTTGKITASPDPTTRAKLSYKSITQSVVGDKTGVVPIHDYIYMYMNNAYAGDPYIDSQVPLLPVIIRPGMNATSGNNTNETFWGDPSKIESSPSNGGAGTYLSNLHGYDSALTAPKTTLGHGVLSDPDDPNAPSTPTITSHTYDSAHTLLVQLAQKYVRDKPDTMYGEFSYLWSTETQYPYFYALVKDTLDAAGRYDYTTGIIDNDATLENPWQAGGTAQLGVILNSLTGMNQGSADDINAFYGATRSNFMYQSGATGSELSTVYDKAMLPLNASSGTAPVFTGYVRDVLDLESMFHNVIPYMYQMTVTTGGLTGDHKDDKGLFGKSIITEGQYKTFAGLPHSWLYRSNWATKIVEAPAYNKSERIGYYDGDTKKTATINMTYLPDAYKAIEGGGRDMIFSEAQMRMEGLSEHDLTTLELKLIQLNKDVVNKWTTMINYVNVNGMTPEVMSRQMALDATLAFNEAVTPKGLGSTAYSLIPSSVDLRSLSFDTILRVILLNTSKDTNFFGTSAVENVVTNFGLMSGILLLIVTWVCIYGVTIVRAFFLAFLFLMGVFGVARGIFASNSSKKATLLGYITSVGVLFALSYVYYQVFNVLMTGADSHAYINDGLRGAEAPPVLALIIILVASLIYIWLIYKMFRLTLDSFFSGSMDLGYGAYKDKARIGIDKAKRGWNSLSMGHAYEDMSSRASGGSMMQGVSGSTSSTTKKNRRGTITPSGAGSGSGALQNSTAGINKGSGTVTALDDYESVDATIRRAGQPSTPAEPTLTLDDYLSVPNKPETKNTKQK